MQKHSLRRLFCAVLFAMGMVGGAPILTMVPLAHMLVICLALAWGHALRIMIGGRPFFPDLDKLAIGKLGKPHRDDPCANLHTAANDGADIVLQQDLDRLDGGSVIRTNRVYERAVGAATDGGSRHDVGVDQRIDDDASAQELPRPKLEILVGKHRLEFDRPGCDVNLIVDRLQDAACQHAVACSLQGLDLHVATGKGRRNCRQIALWQREYVCYGGDLGEQDETGASAACTILPGSTRRSPVRPLIGDAMTV